MGVRAIRERRERERRKKAAEWKAYHAQERAEIAAIEMLLDANWSQSNGHFVKVVKQEAYIGGFLTMTRYVTEFYDRNGQYIGNDQ